MDFKTFETVFQEQELPLFTLSDVKVLCHRLNPDYLRLKLARWKKKGYIKSPKRGLYILEGAKPDEFEIASKLVNPSYISLETALSHYSIIPDISAEVSSITTKNTRVFRTKSTTFRFFHVKPDLFSDFRHLRDDIFIATPEKAILDFFYFRKPGLDHPFFERVNPEKLRLLHWKAMEKMAKRFPAWTQKIFHSFAHAFAP